MIVVEFLHENAHKPGIGSSKVISFGLGGLLIMDLVDGLTY